MATLIPTSVKNVFQGDLTNDNLESVWSEITIEGKVVLIGNIFIHSTSKSKPTASSR